MFKTKTYLQSLSANKLNQNQANYKNETSVNKKKIRLEMKQSNSKPTCNTKKGPLVYYDRIKWGCCVFTTIMVTDWEEAIISVVKI